MFEIKYKIARLIIRIQMLFVEKYSESYEKFQEIIEIINDEEDFEEVFRVKRNTFD